MLCVWSRDLGAGSGSLTVRGQTYLSPRVLGFQVGDIGARRGLLITLNCGDLECRNEGFLAVHTLIALKQPMLLEWILRYL